MADLDPCGTKAAYVRHLRYGEEPCAPCKKANVAYMKQYLADHPEKKARANARRSARNRALTRLSHIYPDIFDALLNEELSKETTR